MSDVYAKHGETTRLAARFMQDFLLTITAYTVSASGPIQYESLRDQLAGLGLKDYLINDANEWIALPDNMYAAWVEGTDSDTILKEWHTKLASLFGPGHARGAFFVAVGSDAAWQAQVFE